MVYLGIILLVGLIGTVYPGVIQTTPYPGSNQNTVQKCLTGPECTNQNSLSIMNNQVFCCPNGKGLSSSSSWVNGQSYIDCTCSSGGAIPANFDTEAWNRGWANYHNSMSNMNQQLSNMNQRLSNMFSGGFPFNNNRRWR